MKMVLKAKFNTKSKTHTGKKLAANKSEKTGRFEFSYKRGKSSD